MAKKTAKKAAKKKAAPSRMEQMTEAVGHAAAKLAERDPPPEMARPTK